MLQHSINLVGGKLFAIGYHNADTDRKLPSKEDLINIINFLEKRKKEF
ncbi:MAG: hypothetical protein ACP5H9_03085 [Candidatus Woesearchaeota archaeon]